jgi:hypothetical protein
MAMTGSDDKTETPLSKLRQGLNTAFTQESTLPRTPENERERLAAGLVFVAQFVAAEIDRDIANKYFFELSSALTDLNDGTVRPLLEHSSLRTRADSSDKWRARARIAVALDALMRSGLRQTDAANEIADKNRGLHTLAGKTAAISFSTTIIGWREEFIRKRVKNFEAAVLFEEGIRRIDEMYEAGDFDGLKALAVDQLKKAGKSRDA